MRSPEDEVKGKLNVAIRAAVGYDRVYMSVPDNVQYPYIVIDDTFINEDGPKGSFRIDLDQRIQVVFRQDQSTRELTSDTNKVLSIVNNGSPFALDDNFKIEQMVLESKSGPILIKEDSLTTNVNVLQFRFDILDLL